jgi:hypothetical protein
MELDEDDEELVKQSKSKPRPKGNVKTYPPRDPYRPFLIRN